MPIPEFDSLGLLPAGVWDCDLAEIRARFCWNPHRRKIWNKCNDFIDSKLRPIGLTQPIWIDGSFVRNKAEPSDVDLVADCEGADTLALGSVMELRFQHAQLKELYRVDFWMRHPQVKNDLTSFFQYAGDKCALDLNIDPKHPKGILRVAL